MSQDLLDLARRLAGEVRPSSLSREDISQEAYLAALTIAAAWEGRGEKKILDECAKWKTQGVFLPAAARKYIRRMLKRAYRAAVSRGVKEEYSEEQSVDREPMPEDNAQASELWARVEPLLTPRQAQVIHATIWDGASNTDVSLSLGISYNAVAIAKRDGIAAIRESRVCVRQLSTT